MLIVSASLMVGCWPQQWTLPPDAPPRPIGELSLPVYPPTSSPQVRLEVRAFIQADGTVREALISPSSGNDEWDSLAASSIRRWRFTPAMQGGSAVPLWIRFLVMLRFVEPRDMVLAEIVCPTRELADSLHALLIQGADFGALARLHSTAATRDRDGYMGRIDLTSYPLTVQMTVTSIGEGEVTKPLRVGDGFVILKRVSEQK